MPCLPGIFGLVHQTVHLGDGRLPAAALGTVNTLPAADTAVERIPAGRLDLVPDLAGLLVGASVGDGACDEVVFERGHQLRILLADRLAQHVRLTQVEASERMRDGHELLLVGHQAIGVLRRLIRPEVIDRNDLAALITHVLLRSAYVERCRTVKGVDDNQVLDIVRLHVHDELGDAARGELEDVLGISVGKQAVGFLIAQFVTRNIFQRVVRAVFAIDIAENGPELRELLGCQDILFEQADLLHGVSVQLRDQQAVHLADRQKVETFGRAPVFFRRSDDDGRSVDRGCARLAHDPPYIFHHLGIVIHETPHFRVTRRQAEQVGPGHVVVLENRRDVIHKPVRHAVDARHVLDRSLEFQGRERPGREDPLPPIGIIPPLQIFTDLLAAVGLYVRVDIRERKAAALPKTAPHFAVEDRKRPVRAFDAHLSYFQHSIDLLAVFVHIPEQVLIVEDQLIVAAQLVGIDGQLLGAAQDTQSRITLEKERMPIEP